MKLCYKEPKSDNGYKLILIAHFNKNFDLQENSIFLLVRILRLPLVILLALHDLLLHPVARFGHLRLLLFCSLSFWFVAHRLPILLKIYPAIIAMRNDGNITSSFSNKIPTSGRLVIPNLKSGILKKPVIMEAIAPLSV